VLTEVSALLDPRERLDFAKGFRFGDCGGSILGFCEKVEGVAAVAAAAIFAGDGVREPRRKRRIRSGNRQVRAPPRRTGGAPVEDVVAAGDENFTHCERVLGRCGEEEVLSAEC